MEVQKYNSAPADFDMEMMISTHFQMYFNFTIRIMFIFYVVLVEITLHTAYYKHYHTEIQHVRNSCSDIKHSGWVRWV